MSLIKDFQAGGIFMYFILMVGFIVAGIIIERSLALYKAYKAAPADLRTKLLTFISLGQFAEAKAYVEMAAANTSMSKVVIAGLQVRQAGGGDEEVQARMDEALTSEISMIDRRTGFLAVLGNIATLLGLLGTVTGLISSFTSVTNANPAERALLLGQGISEALNTTAFGLVVAIPALVAFALLQNRTDRIVSGLTEDASKIFHDLLFRTDSNPKNEKNRGMRSSISTAEGYTQQEN
ncbi:MAG: MotA/TolQ/ExbB proton channel family protein [Bacteriovoracaceae bacterium]|nr:MotA/TolQ/ExbB proton channel family protein [Bacteriovoracaceae bacterium]